MNDKSPIYMLMIVGIVAVVAIIVMLTTPSAPSDKVEDLGNDGAISGNVVFEHSSFEIDWGIVGKVFFAAIMVGAFVYMYKFDN